MFQTKEEVLKYYKDKSLSEIVEILSNETGIKPIEVYTVKEQEEYIKYVLKHMNSH